MNDIASMMVHRLGLPVFALSWESPVLVIACAGWEYEKALAWLAECWHGNGVRP